MPPRCLAENGRYGKKRMQGKATIAIGCGLMDIGRCPAPGIELHLRRALCIKRFLLFFPIQVVKPLELRPYR